MDDFKSGPRRASPARIGDHNPRKPNHNLNHNLTDTLGQLSRIPHYVDDPLGHKVKQDVNAKTNCPYNLSLGCILSACACLYVFLLQAKLPPGANRILFVKNLNYQITGDDLYDLFGRYGSIRQIRIGNEAKTKGTAFVVFDDVMDVRPPATLCPFPLLPALALDSKRLTSVWFIGQKCIGTPKWVPFARTIYRGLVPHACEAGRGGSQGGAGTERRGVGAAEEEA
jgi:hypothetical protein